MCCPPTAGRPDLDTCLCQAMPGRLFSTPRTHACGAVSKTVQGLNQTQEPSWHMCIAKQCPPVILARSSTPATSRGDVRAASSGVVRAACERAGTRRRGAWTARRSSAGTCALPSSSRPSSWLPSSTTSSAPRCSGAHVPHTGSCAAVDDGRLRADVMMLHSVALCLIGRMRSWPRRCPAGQAGSARVLCVRDRGAPGDAVWLAADVCER